MSMDYEIEELLQGNTDRLKDESVEEYYDRMAELSEACLRKVMELDPRIKGIKGLWGCKGLELSDTVKGLIFTSGIYFSAATDPIVPEYKGDDND